MTLSKIKSKKFFTAILSGVLATSLVFSGIALAGDDDDIDPIARELEEGGANNEGSDEEASQYQQVRQALLTEILEPKQLIELSGNPKGPQSVEEWNRIVENLDKAAGKKGATDALIRSGILKLPSLKKDSFLTAKWKEVKKNVKNTFSVTILKRFVSTIAMKYVKGWIVSGVKSAFGVDLVGKTYSPAEMARLVDSIDESVDTISENIKIASAEFSSMMGETAYRDFMECVSRIKTTHAMIQDKYDAALLWGMYKAGGDANTSTKKMNKYANQAFAEFLDGRYYYIDDLIAHYTEFKTRILTSFTNNGKGIIDVVDEALDKQNDVFSETYAKKQSFRESIANVALTTATLLDSITLVNDDLDRKYSSASKNAGLSLTEINKLLEDKELVKKYKLTETDELDANGKKIIKELANPYLVSKNAYAKSPESLSRNIFYWSQISKRPDAELPKGLHDTGTDNYLIAIAPFRMLLKGLVDPGQDWLTNGRYYMKTQQDDFKNNDLPIYNKWDDVYLGRDDISKLLSHKPAGVSIKDYLVKNLKFDLGKDVSNMRYLVTDCKIDYTYHEFMRDDFEMRLSYFDLENGLHYSDQVVARGDLSGGARTYGEGPLKSYNPDAPLTRQEVMHSILSQTGADAHSGSGIKGTEVNFINILAGSGDIFAIPYGK